MCCRLSVSTVVVIFHSFIVLGITGCGRGIETYPVTVHVSFPDGKTLEGAIVAFQSMPDPDAGENAKSISAIGKVGSDGICRMMTQTPGDGAIAGRHRVTVAPPPLPGGSGDLDEMGRIIPEIHPRFRKSDTSGLEVTVTPDGPNEFRLEIERP